jgi:hypothetical protein
MRRRRSVVFSGSGGKLDDITIIVAVAQQGVDDSVRDKGPRPRPAFTP